MIMSVYLHKYVADILKQFGNLSDVINDVLEYCDAENGLTDYPACQNRQGCGRYNVDINYEPYIEVYTKYGITSPRASIRRILYYFVDNELYSTDEWLNIRTPSITNNEDKYIINKLDDVYRILNKIYSKCSIGDKEDVINIMSYTEKLKLKLLKGEIVNETEERS